MAWYSHLFQNFPQFIVIPTVKGFGIVNKAEIDVFQELSCFFYDPADVGNLISGSSAFSKTSLNIRKFTVHILLKTGLDNFEHYFTSMWDECNCAVVWAFFGIAFGIGMKSDLFQSCGHAEFSKFAGTEELYKKDLHDPDNHDGVSTHLKPDILKCAVKWALGNITTNNARGGDGIPVELFQILKDDTVKVFHSICQQICKTQQCPQH